MLLRSERPSTTNPVECGGKEWLPKASESRYKSKCFERTRQLYSLQIVILRFYKRHLQIYALQFDFVKLRSIRIHT